jgi:hypothetical protein
MAVTAHWIQCVFESAPSGSGGVILKLRADLIGFHQIPGRHDGEHLAQTFLYILKRLEIVEKVCKLCTNCLRQQLTP